MKRLIAFGLFLNAAFIGIRAWQEAVAQEASTPAGNGDVNGDGRIDIADASHLLNWLFLGGPEPRPIAACPSRFLDNGDGTVTDRTTGLVWLRQSVDINDDGARDELDSITKPAAEELTGDFELAGHRDWVLPTTLELMSLVDPAREGSIDPIFDLPSGLYWIGSTNSGDPCHGCNFAVGLGEQVVAPGSIEVHGDHDWNYRAQVLLVRRP